MLLQIPCVYPLVAPRSPVPALLPAGIQRRSTHAHGSALGQTLARYLAAGFGDAASQRRSYMCRSPLAWLQALCSARHTDSAAPCCSARVAPACAPCAHTCVRWVGHGIQARHADAEHFSPTTRAAGAPSLLLSPPPSPAALSPGIEVSSLHRGVVNVGVAKLSLV